MTSFPRMSMEVKNTAPNCSSLVVICSTTVKPVAVLGVRSAGSRIAESTAVVDVRVAYWDRINKTKISVKQVENAAFTCAWIGHRPQTVHKGAADSIGDSGRRPRIGRIVRNSWKKCHILVLCRFDSNDNNDNDKQRRKDSCMMRKKKWVLRGKAAPDQGHKPCTRTLSAADKCLAAAERSLGSPA